MPDEEIRPPIVCVHFPADADGHPYFGYFDNATQLGFTWCGYVTHPIQVTHGGMGEPVIDTFPVANNRGAVRVHHPPPTYWLEFFRRQCDRYVSVYNARRDNGVLEGLEEQFNGTEENG